MIDLTQELIPMAQVPEYLADRGAKKVSSKVPYLWALRGLKGIRLDTLSVGGTLHTSRQALERFFQELSED